MLSELRPLIEQDVWCLVAVNQYVANYKCYIKGSGDRVSGNRRSISTIISMLHFRVWSQTRNWSSPDLTYTLVFVIDLCVFFFSLIAGTTWRPAVWTRGWTQGKGTPATTVLTWPVRRTVAKPPARTETLTGITTASHRGVVVGVVAAGEAATGTKIDGADVATLATGHPRYGNLLLLSTRPSPVYTTRSKGSLSLVFSHCLTPISLSLCISVCVLHVTVKHDFQ